MQLMLLYKIAACAAPFANSILLRGSQLLKHKQNLYTACLTSWHGNL